jgi:hypothetical protein
VDLFNVPNNNLTFVFIFICKLCTLLKVSVVFLVARVDFMECQLKLC